MTHQETSRHLCISFAEGKSSESAHGWLERSAWWSVTLCRVETVRPRRQSAAPLQEAAGFVVSWEAQ